MRSAAALLLLAALGGCASVPMPASGLRALGTESFWGVTLDETSLTYSTPELQPGRRLPATRRGNTWRATLDGAALTLTLRRAECSDGMSDRRYPYAARLTLGRATYRGCAG